MTRVVQRRALDEGGRSGALLRESCLHELAEASARAFPDAPAILFKGASVRYDALLRRARRLACELRRRGVGEGSIVAFYLPRSPDLIAAQLAVLQAGAAYLALDRTAPVHRTRFVLGDSGPALVLTLRSLAADLGTSIPALLLDEDVPDIAVPVEGSLPRSRPESAAYVTYTSGSTGRPKGAIAHHRGAVNYIAHMIAARGLRPGDRVLQSTTFSFDGSVRDTLGALAFGGMIVLLDDDQARNPLAQLAVLRAERASHILSIVPTTLRAMARSSLDDGLGAASLRLIMVAGEALMPADLATIGRAFGPEVQIVNQYGATECSMVTTDYPVPAGAPTGSGALPIGRPIPNCRISILGPDLRPVKPGEEGEIWIGGAGVGLGYLNRPDLTAERFLPDPSGDPQGGRMYRTGDLARTLPDGTIQYLGRSDRQVKVRGNRVEPEEIESLLREHPAVREAAVVPVGDPPLGRLHAHVVLTDGLGTGELREFLAARVPAFMVPSSWTVLETMPRTTSGKIDRSRLPRPDAPGDSGAAPPTSRIEARLVSIWQSALGADVVGVTDDFFELGGDSLSAAVLLTRIETRYGLSLEPSVLIEHGTIARLATLIEQGGIPSHPGVVSLQPLGSKDPLFLCSAHLYLREFASGFSPHRPVYALQAGRSFTGSVEDEAQVHLEHLLAFRPEGPYLLAGHSASGYVAIELARLLIRAGKPVRFLGLVDTFPPGRQRQAAPMERLRLHLESLRRNGARKAIGYYARSMTHAARRTMSLVPGGRRPSVLLGKDGAEWEEDLDRSYAPQPFSGPVTLFVARERPSYMRWDPMASWSRHLTGSIEVVRVAGDHVSAMRGPCAASLARTVEDLLP